MAEVNPSEDDFLPVTAYAVLGLLSFGRDLSGYELRQWALGSLRFFYWSPAQSQIYRELRRLEAEGYVTSEAVEQHDRPDKKVYSLTDDGQRELCRWIDEAPVERPVIKHPVALRMFLGHLTGPHRLRELLEEHRRSLDSILEELESTAIALEDDPTAQFARKVAQWGMHFYGGDLSGTDEVLADREEIQART